MKSALELEREARIGERCWGRAMRCDGAQLVATQHPGRFLMAICAADGSRDGGRGPDPKLKRLPRAPPAAANKARLAEIGLVQTVQAIANTQTEQARARRAAKAATRAARKAAGAAPSGRVRRCAAPLAGAIIFQPMVDVLWRLRMPAGAGGPPPPG